MSIAQRCVPGLSPYEVEVGFQPDMLLLLPLRKRIPKSNQIKEVINAIIIPNVVACTHSMYKNFKTKPSHIRILGVNNGAHLRSPESNITHVD